MWLASWPPPHGRNLGNHPTPERALFHAHSLLPRYNREIIRGPAGARQRKMPPLLRIVHKTLLGHHGNQQITPPTLLRRDGRRRRVRLEVGAVVAGAHIDACFRSAGARISGAIPASLVRIEPG